MQQKLVSLPSNDSQKAWNELSEAIRDVCKDSLPRMLPMKRLHMQRNIPSKGVQPDVSLGCMIDYLNDGVYGSNPTRHITGIPVSLALVAVQTFCNLLMILIKVSVRSFWSCCSCFLGSYIFMSVIMLPATLGSLAKDIGQVSDRLDQFKTNILTRLESIEDRVRTLEEKALEPAMSREKELERKAPIKKSPGPTDERAISDDSDGKHADQFCTRTSASPTIREQNGACGLTSSPPRLCAEDLGKLQKTLTDFLADKVGINAGDQANKKEIVELVYKDYIRRALGEDLHKPYYAGSAYEKLQSGDAHDYDVMLYINVKRGGVKWQAEDHPRDKAFAVIKGSEQFNGWTDSDGLLSALKVRESIKSKIDQAIPKTLTYSKGECTITRKSKGPSITLEITHKNQFSFTIDFVISISMSHVSTDHLSSPCDFVAKPFNKKNTEDRQVAHYWRKSYSTKEKEMLEKIDTGNGIRRQLLRIVKLVVRHNAQLKSLPTYFYKNALLSMCDDAKMEWNIENLAQRFVDFIHVVKRAVEEKTLLVYFNKEVNLLQDVTKNHESLKNFLKRIQIKGLSGYEKLLKDVEKSLEKEKALYA